MPCYSLDEVRGHFRMTRNTFESLSQELAATGSIPHGNRFGRKATLGILRFDDGNVNDNATNQSFHWLNEVK